MKTCILILVVSLLIAASTFTHADTKVLAWEDRSDLEDGFLIERKEGAAGAWHVVGSVGRGVRSFTDTFPESGKNYTWRVRSFNLAGMSSPSNEVTATIPVSPVPPSPVTSPGSLTLK